MRAKFHFAPHKAAVLAYPKTKCLSQTFPFS